jgi:CheY-like chemotaxis protein
MLTTDATEVMPRILCVDDEPAVLEGLERVLYESYEVHAETVPARALARLSSEGPFDVVISDMRMPEMDGATFLAAASRAVPDTMRILLTGYADVDAAVAAVNDGRILRFLRKPCDPDELCKALECAVQQRRLILAERELLQSTLSGAVRALAEMLELLAPEIFRRASALSRAAGHVAAKLRFEPRWALEVAARLCQVGCLALPSALLERERAGEPLSQDERALLDAHPETGFHLLAHIPRLEIVATMVRYQRKAQLPPGLPPAAALGARVLHLLHEIDQRERRGQSFVQARLVLRRGAVGLDATILDALADYTPPHVGAVVNAVAFKDLVVGVVLAEDVIAKSGAVIVTKGSEVTQVVRERLANFARGVGIREPLHVRSPA